MPELSEDRIKVLDHRAGHYLCFPDICRTADGNLIAVYGEFDQHAGTRRKLIVKYSSDDGESWSLPRVLRAGRAHCPRINVLSDGQIICVDDDAITALWSLDNGENFSENKILGFSPHMLTSHILELNTDTFLMTGHSHRGSQPVSLIRQPPSEQMVYISYNRGNDWNPYSILAYEKDLVLCEADMVRLPGGEILALMRENSFVYEPMYAAISRDDGKSWSDPMPTCLIGHRPSIGITSTGRLLVTYRNCGPDGGTAAWMGTAEELLKDFKVHGRVPSDSSLIFNEDGMRVLCSEPDDGIRFVLRPFTDPAKTAAEFEAEVRVDQADAEGCAIHFGIWWRIYPDRIMAMSPENEELDSFPLFAGKFNSLKFIWNRGMCTLYLEGEAVYEISIDAASAEARPIIVGCSSLIGENRCDCTWKRMKLRICDSGRSRDYVWTWHHSWGRPDQWVKDHVLELANDRNAAFGDYGYSGWTEIDSGVYYAVWHHGGSNESSYIKGRSSRIIGATINDSDFGF